MDAKYVIGIFVLFAAIGGVLLYQSNQRAAATEAYNRSLGGSIANTVAGIGGIIGAAVGGGAS